MPSRTYIEMALALNFRGRYPLPRQTVVNFSKVVFELYGRPELIEEIVRKRVETIKFIRNSGVYLYLHRHHYTMIDYVIACKLLDMNCYSAMAWRAGKDWFSKVLAYIWYGEQEAPSRTFKPKSVYAVLNRVPHNMSACCYICSHKDECVYNDGRRIDACSDFIYDGSLGGVKDDK